MPKETDQAETVYREGATEQPPEALDQTIAAAARNALKPWYQRRGPLTGLSTAAALLLAAGLVSIQYLPEGNTPITEFRDQSADTSAAVKTVSSEGLTGAAEAKRERLNEYQPAAPVARMAPASETRPAPTPAREPAAGVLSVPQSTDRAAMEKYQASAGMDQRAAAVADTDDTTCQLPPDSEDKAYRILADDGGPMRIQSEGREWHCVDGVWKPVTDLEGAADERAREAPLHEASSTDAVSGKAPSQEQQ